MRASAFLTSLEWLQSFSLVAKSSSVDSDSATSPSVAASASQLARTAAQQYTLSRSAKLSPSVETVVFLTVRKSETAWLGRPELAR